MTTILFAFLVSLLLSTALTPIARWLGLRYGAIDEPGERQVHTCTIPRSGGAVIFLSFFLTLFACSLLTTQVSNLLVWGDTRFFGIVGAVVVFSVGFYDDFHRLTPKVKFLLQIVAASLAFYGGLRIEGFQILGLEIHFGVMNYFITVFWFLLFINAVNLIDGLDGLAVGIGVFASIVMVFLGIMQSDYLIAMEFAALGGTLLGFLHYNFNPARIFLGDGGSYFIGYAIAALAILGSTKTQVSATLLIPLIALGVPIFDTILSPLRRFILGKRMFQADREHIHHRMLQLGFSTRKVVLIVYSVTCVLCLFALLLVNYRSELIGLPLIILAVGSVVFTRKLGYLAYIDLDKIYDWVKDMSDVSGISRHRRIFLNLKVDIDRSQNIDELWGNICKTLEILQFDRVELHVNRNGKDRGGVSASIDKAENIGQSQRDERRQRNSQRRESVTNPLLLNICTEEADVRIWARGYYRRGNDTSAHHFLKIVIPLGNYKNIYPPRLVLFKDIKGESLQRFTLQRVENLRRAVTSVMERLPGIKKTLADDQTAITDS